MARLARWSVELDCEVGPDLSLFPVEGLPDTEVPLVVAVCHADGNDVYVRRTVPLVACLRL